VSEEQTHSARSSILRFVESLKGNKSFEGSREYVRVTPKGLFVDERAAPGVVTTYQAWFERESQGAARKTEEKTKQWLFDSTEPERLYLVEGKHVLFGFLIPIPIPSPQTSGLPFYLGSLLSAASYLHPSDPELTGVRGLELRRGRLGLEAIIKRRDKQVLVPEASIRAFQTMAGGSRFLQRRYPGCEKSLAIAVRTLTGLVRRARVVPREFPLVVPFSVKISRAKEVRAAGKFLFIEEKGVLVQLLEMSGRNLSGFLRAELVRAPHEKLGSFKLTPKHRDLMGFYEQGRQRVSVHARAFAEFEELVRRARDPRERFAGWFTSAECFEKFSMFFQLSQPIDKRKIASALERFGIEGSSFRIHGGWIFCLSREGTVMRTVAKHIRLPGHRRTRE